MKETTIEDVKDLIRYYVPVRQHADIVINQLIKIVTQPFSGKETRESVLESVMQRTGAVLFNSARETALIAMTEYASLNRQGWTRVEDGNLPAQGERVLVYCEGGLIEKGYRIGMLWERDWAGTTFHEAGYKVTHWMPLPNKPI